LLRDVRLDRGVVSIEVGVLDKSRVLRVVGRIKLLTVRGSFALKLVNPVGRLRVVSCVIVEKSSLREEICVEVKVNVVSDEGRSHAEVECHFVRSIILLGRVTTVRLGGYVKLGEFKLVLFDKSSVVK
jgi:hypothetical protein